MNSPSSCRLLLVDDEPHELKLYKVMLESAGFQVICAHDGQEGLELASQIPVDGIVSDVLMPRLDGFGLCETLRQSPRLAALPVVLLSSSYTEPEDFRLAKDVRANALIARTADVQCTVNRIIDGLQIAPLSGPVSHEAKELHDRRVVRQLQRQMKAARRSADKAERSELQADEYRCALQESQERLRQIEENMREVFFIVGSGGQPIHYVSPGYERIWGRTCQSLYEHPLSWMDAIHPQDRAAVETFVAQFPDEGTLEYRIRRPDGKTRWIRARTFHVRDPKDGIPRWVGSAEDITERKCTEEQLRQSQKLETIGHIAAGVAHELNNPLCAILGFTESLIRQPDAPDRLDMLRTIEREVRRCGVLVQEMLAFTRRPADARTHESLPKLIDGVVSMIGTRAKICNVVLERHDGGEIPSIHVNGNQIQQVLINLCANALDAMPNGGTLSIDTSTAGSDVIIRIRDNGVGMTPECLEHIFDPFFTTKDVGKGTGLGLSLARDIINSHKGRIDVRSTLGSGTVFEISLPRETL